MATTIPQLPNTTAPQLTDLLALSRPSQFSGGGTDYNVTLSALGALIGGGGGGGGSTIITAATDFSAINIFQMLHYGVSNTALGSANVTALNNLATAAKAVGGGEVWLINVGGLPVNLAGTVSFSTNDFLNSVNVHSTSNAMQFQQSLGVDTFFTKNPTGGDNNLPGVSFSDINVLYATGLTTGAAFDIQSRNAYLQRLVIENAPIGVIFQNNLSGTLRDSDIWYKQNLGSVGAIIGGTAGRSHQTRIERCQVEFNNTGTSSSIGFQIVSCDHATIVDSYAFGCYNGIAIQPMATGGNDCQQVDIDNVQIGAQNFGIQIQPQSPASSKVQDVRVFGGQIQGGGSAIPSSVGVFIDTQGASNAFVDGLQFIGVLVESWGTSGYTITSGQNIQITGGRSNSNGTSGLLLATNSATGPSNVNCVGLDLSATYQNNSAQTNSVVIDMPNATTGSASFTDCPMLGYASGISHFAITAIAAGFILNVVNCPGYNDQKTPIAADGTNMPTSVTSAALRGYYGPSVWTFGTGVTSYTKNGVTYTNSGLAGVELTLQPYDTIFQTGSTNGSWVGY